MKDFKKFTIIALAGLGLFSCSDNEVLNPDSSLNAEIKDPVYMSFSLKTPGSRSATNSGSDDNYGSSTDGTEQGTDTENKVNRITIVLATVDDNEYITHTYAEIGDENMIQSASDWYIVKFSAQALNEHAGKNIHVFMFCNHAGNLVNTTTWSSDQTFSLTNAADTTPWADTGIYMSNAEAITSTQVTLPTLEGWDQHKTPANPFSLGEVRVERSVARFDIKPGGDVDNQKPHTYYVRIDTDGKQATATDDGDKLATITLTDVALINQSSQAYMLRRVSDNGLNTGNNLKIGGTEWFTAGTTTAQATGNFVVDVDAVAKQAYPAEDNTALYNTFHYHLTAPSTWVWTQLAELTTPDNTIEPSGVAGYNRWRYTMENTIPAASATDLTSAQKKGITTGVVFKGKLELKSDIDATTYVSLKTAFENKNPLFVFENQLIGDFSMLKVKAEAKDDNGELLWPNLTAAYLSVDWMNYFAGKEITDHGLAANPGGDYGVETPGNADFTVYTYEENYGYPVYYYYYNRHNDNGNDEVMGIMEFGVVRNNVYKLMVEDILLYGHPSPDAPDEDPDPENPEDPNEDDNQYVKVLVKVLPWVVRVNNIQF